MGSSAKVTRGGNKKRVNQQRQAAKLRAQGAKAHTTSVKESVEARRRQKQRSMAIASSVKANATPSHSTGVGAGAPVVRMTPRVAVPPKAVAPSAPPPPQ